MPYFKEGILKSKPQFDKREFRQFEQRQAYLVGKLGWHFSYTAKTHRMRVLQAALRKELIAAEEFTLHECLLKQEFPISPLGKAEEQYYKVRFPWQEK